MKLLRADIIEFAAFRDTSFEFSEGLNIIEGHNESGKSSLLAFIKFMLYGFKSRASGGELSERDKYLSWSGGRAAGTLTVYANGKRLRIEREGIMRASSGRSSYDEKQVKIINADTGDIESVGECPGELLLGISAATFSSSCMTAQLSSSILDGSEVGTSIENMLLAADKNISIKRSCDKLDKARIELQHKNGKGGKIFELKNTITELSSRLLVAEQDTEQIRKKEAHLDLLRQNVETEKAELSKLEAVGEASNTMLTLKRFDRFRELEREISETRNSLDTLENSSFPEGALPDGDTALRLEAHIRELSLSASSVSDAELNFNRHSLSPTYDSDAASAADALREAGITDKKILLDAEEKCRRAASKLTALGIILASLGAALCAAAVIFFPIIAAGVLMAAGGIFCLVRASNTKKAHRAYLTSLSLPTEGGAEAISAYCDRLSAAVAAREKHRELADALAGLLATHRKKLAACRTSASEAVKKYTDAPLPSDVSELSAEISKTVGKIKEFALHREQFLYKLSLIERELGELKEVISKYDEGFLRQRAARIKEENLPTPEQCKQLREQSQARLAKALDAQTNVEKQLIALRSQTYSPARLAADIAVKQAELELLCERADALTLARECIGAASGQLRRGFTPELRRRAASLLSSLTEGKYPELSVSEDLSVAMLSEGSTRPLSAFSGGTRDAAYLSLRIALAEMLCAGCEPPLLLDEAFSQLDDDRARRLLTFLGEWCKEGKQCLIFTCHSREAAMAEDFKHITL